MSTTVESFQNHTTLTLPRNRASIEEEASWRWNTKAKSSNDQPSIEIGRWNKWHAGTHELIAPTFENHYTIEVLLGETYVDCFNDEKHVTGKLAGFGSTQVAAPGQQIRCRFDRSTEAIHLFIPRPTILTACEELQHRNCAEEIAIFDPCFATDPTMGRLIEAIAGAYSLHDAFISCYVESLMVAILARLIGARSDLIADRSSSSGLVKWRLRRAIDFIEANLQEHVTLSDIAKHAGLSRMHFAAQFRRATGFTPHQFLTLRRVERAKSLLSEGRLEIVEISANVGFHSQAYFTSVFRKITGTTPSCWRRSTSYNNKNGWT
ncbi:AraC-like DNA-binding protein [Paraburkholderia sp. BL6669N2]|uniref:helix-turn-helix domain-containing protein n=1 Tax=Paraburkholderia sp. BL6669N2 TaxID=1938807 RepID=UPI000E26238A|nr:AraC family transcriptional regulator [Paraburkholderia sp. BL6669N2]REG49604.1 AraC-like DNA-binding protein [Paraburkholderia sp. BL6669N2]